MTKLSPHLPIPHPTKNQLQLNWLWCLQSYVFCLHPHLPQRSSLAKDKNYFQLQSVHQDKIRQIPASGIQNLLLTETGILLSTCTAFHSHTLAILYLPTKGKKKKKYLLFKCYFGGRSLKKTMYHAALSFLRYLREALTAFLSLPSYHLFLCFLSLETEKDLDFTLRKSTSLYTP